MLHDACQEGTATREVRHRKTDHRAYTWTLAAIFLPN